MSFGLAPVGADLTGTWHILVPNEISIRLRGFNEHLDIIYFLSFLLNLPVSEAMDGFSMGLSTKVPISGQGLVTWPSLGQSDILFEIGIWSEVSTRTEHGLDWFTLRHFEDNLLFPATQLFIAALWPP